MFLENNFVNRFHMSFEIWFLSESFAAILMITNERLFSRINPFMNIEISFSEESLIAVIIIANIFPLIQINTIFVWICSELTFRPKTLQFIWILFEFNDFEITSENFNTIDNSIIIWFNIQNIFNTFTELLLNWSEIMTNCLKLNQFIQQIRNDFHKRRLKFVWKQF